MAERQYGGVIPVNLNPIIAHIAAKMDGDRIRLSEIIMSEDLTDFTEQTRLLMDIQAARRAIHVLTGETDIDGERVTNGLANTIRDQQGGTPYSPDGTMPDKVNGNLLAKELGLDNNSDGSEPDQTEDLEAEDQENGAMDEGESPTARKRAAAIAGG